MKSEPSRPINDSWQPEYYRYFIVRIGNTKYLGYFVDDFYGIELLSLGSGRTTIRKIGSVSMMFCYYLTKKEANNLIRQTLVSLVKRKYQSARIFFRNDHIDHYKKKKESIISDISDIWSF